MTEAEKQAIETMKHWINYEKANKDKINKADELIEIQETVLNLIEKQQGKIERLKTARDNWKKTFYQAKAELEKKDAVIDEMAKRLIGITFSDKDDIEIIFDNKEDLKEYFKKKVNSSEQE